VPGLLAVIGCAVDYSALDLSFEALGPLVTGHKACGSGFVARFTTAKFLRDKVFQDDDDICVALDGVIFNLEQLKSRYACPDYFQTVKAMYRDLGDTFFREFRGEFAGILCDKSTNAWLCFTNPTSSKPLYYYCADKLFICSSQMDVIAQVLRRLGRSYSLDVVGAYCLLAYAYMLEDYTLVSEIKKVKPGHSVRYQAGSPVVDAYRRFGGEPQADGSPGDRIEELDEVFREAVRLQYAKDRQYGYEHLATLSGGLDSRMNLWVANEMGYKPQVALTFSQKGYLDERIAGAVAADLGAEFLFYSLDNGDYLMRVLPDAVQANGGLVMFAGSAHLLAALKRVDTDRTGLLHTGMLGDAILGTYLTSPSPAKPRPAMRALNPWLVERIAGEAERAASAYDSDEIFLLYNRGFNGMLNGNWTAGQLTESASPFLDDQFLRCALRVPRALRYKERLYHEWILRKYPAAAHYVWEKAKARLSDPVWLRWLKKRLWQAGIVLRWRWDVSSMNPFHHWYRTNAVLRQSVAEYWRKHEHWLDGYPELKKDCAEMFHARGSLLRGPLTAKMLVMTLLEAMKLYFG